MRRRRKDVQGLLEDMIWQNAIQVYYLKLSFEELQKITEGISNMANIEEVTAAVARIEGNTANVERALGVLNTTNAELVQKVADLQAIIEGGGTVTAAQLQELADRLTAADVAMDAIAPEAPNVPNEPTPEG